MDKKTKFSIWYILLAIWGVVIVHDLLVQAGEVEHISFSRFEELLAKDQVREAIVGQNYIEGTLKHPEEGRPSKFIAVRVDPKMARMLSRHNVNFRGVVESTWLRDMLAWLVPTALFLGVWFWLARHFAREGPGGGFMAIGKSKARIYVEEATKVTFNDVAGVDEAIDELREIVEFLRKPQTYSRLGGRLPRGVLLVGPPGTGKTLLAKAVAGEAQVPFFSISGSEFVEMFVGVGAARVRDMFEQARSRAPCIIFIDELDALGRARGITAGGSNDEKEQTLNQLLAELDGFDPTIGVVLLAATNRPEILDPALLRAGRFDRQVLVDRPDKAGRLQIFNIHLKNIQYDSDVDAEEIAALTAGFSGADLANLVNEAALLATRRKAPRVTRQDFMGAVERIVAGLEKKNRILTPQERTIVAFHETGHAVVALTLPGTDAVVKVSIIPRGIGALGYTIQRPLEDRYLMSEEELENKMTVMLGGRAAEQLIFGRVSTGAADDLSRVTELARGMVTRYGMDPGLGLVAYETEPRMFLHPSQGPLSHEVPLYSEETAREIDCAVRRRVAAAFERALAILRERRPGLERAANVLLERETLSAEEVRRLLEP